MIATQLISNGDSAVPAGEAASESFTPIYISKEASEAFRDFLKKNQNYLASSAGVFHTDNHSNW